MEEINNRKDNIQDIYNLTSMQEGMLFYTILKENVKVYNEFVSITVKGIIDKEKLKESFEDMIKRHDVLRTSFAYKKLKRPKQVVLRNKQGEFNYVDISNLDEEQAKIYLENYMNSQLERGFDLEKEALIRLTLMKIDKLKCVIMLNFHHIIMDGWSMTNVLGELFLGYYQIQKYGKIKINKPNQFKQYVGWLQNNYDYEGSIKYWTNELNDINKVTKLSTNEISNNYIFEDYVEKIDERMTEKLIEFAAQKNVTLNIILQVAWILTLSKLTKSDDVVFGSVVSGRDVEIEDIEKMVGLFINTLPMRINNISKKSISELINTVQEKQVELIKHGHTALSDIQKLTSFGSKLFDHIFIFENYPSVTSLLEDEVKELGLEFEDGFILEENNYPVAIVVTPNKEIEFKIKYNTTYISLKDLMNIFQTYKSILTNILIGEEANNILMEETINMDRFENDFNNTKVDFGPQRTIVDLFIESVHKNPNKIAIFDGDHQISYGELNRQSDILANYLKYNIGVSKGEYILLTANREYKTIIWILAILKAGAAYIPIDKNIPLERLRNIIVDSKAKYIITDEKYEFEDLCIIEKRNTDVSINSESINESELDSIVYIIYTSGTTGKPKGVGISNSNLFNYLIWAKDMYIKNEENVNMPVFTSLSFDLSVTSIFLPLVSGNSMYIFSEEYDLLDVCNQIIKKRDINLIKLTPAHLNIFSSLIKDKDHGIKRFIVGGEQLYTDLAKKVCENSKYKLEIYNEYGPTEATVGCMTHLFNINEDIGTVVPIGIPIANTKLYILNEKMEQVIDEEPGELYIGGQGVAKGYINNPKMTEERFVQSPFDKEEKLYKTGDMVRFNKNKKMEFIERIDNQIKYNGYRIELDEVRSAIMSNPIIRDAYPFVYRDDINNTHFVAFYISESEIEQAEIKEWLEKIIPKYMIPNNIIRVDSFPLTLNGKIDKSKLIELYEKKSQHKFEAPRNEIEKVLVEAYKTVLKREQVSIYDNFFEMGGDSIKAIQIIALLSDYDIRIKDIMDFPRIVDLSSKISKNIMQISQDAVTGKVPLTPPQIYLKELTNVDSINHFNQSMFIKSNIKLDKDLIRETLKNLIVHHDALRMKYEYGSDFSINGDIDEYDVDVKEYHCTQSNIYEYKNEIQKSFDLAKGPLINAAHFIVEDTSYVLIVMHHWICDGVSQRIIFDDFTAIYNQLLNNEKVNLPKKTHSFKKWSEELYKYSQSEEFMKEKEYWKALEESSKDIKFKSDSKDIYKFKDMRREEFYLESNITEALTKRLPARYGVEINEILLAPLIKAFKKIYFGRCKKMKIFLESHGRQGEVLGLNVNRTIGWFTALYPIVIEDNIIKGPLDINNIKLIREKLKETPNSGIGYSILEKLTPDDMKEDIEFTRKGDILFNHMGSFSELNDNLHFSLVLDENGEEVGKEVCLQFPIVINSVLKDNKLYFSVNYNSCLFKERKMRRILSEYRKLLIKASNITLEEGLENRILREIENYKDKNSNDIATIINPKGKNKVFVFPPAMLKIAYMALFESLFKNFPEYQFHIMHLLKVDGMDEEYCKYIMEQKDNSKIVLLGYSGGANIAFDTALCMEKQGLRANSIIMLDGYKWQEGVQYTTINKDSIDEMLQNFIEESNLDKSIMENDSVKELINKERDNFLTETKLYQDYCQANKDKFLVLNGTNIYNLLSEDKVEHDKDTRLAWKHSTTGTVELFYGKGGHISMLNNDDYLKENIETIKSLLNKSFLSNQVVLELKDIRKSYGIKESKNEILKDINFRLKAGEFVVLLGPSGSGKSTLLNIMSSLEKPDSGSVLYFDEDITNFSKKKILELRRKHIGFVFQAYHLLGNLTVRENVEIGAHLTDGDVDVDEIIEKVKLGKQKNKFPYQLSGGEQQRVAIARAVAKKSTVLFCDEPTGALDTKTGQIVLSLLQHMQKTMNIAIVLVTHNPQVAEIADRVIRLLDGEIISEEVNENPKLVEKVVWK